MNGEGDFANPSFGDPVVDDGFFAQGLGDVEFAPGAMEPAGHAEDGAVNEDGGHSGCNSDGEGGDGGQAELVFTGEGGPAEEHEEAGQGLFGEPMDLKGVDSGGFEVLLLGYSGMFPIAKEVAEDQGFGDFFQGYKRGIVVPVSQREMLFCKALWHRRASSG